MWKGYLSLLKYQTALPQFFPELDETTGWEGWKPVQQVSAQPLEFRDKYLQGDYPEEFWNIVSNNPEDTRGHGSSKHRVDEEGNYLMVGVRGDEPVGDLPTRGPYRPRKGKKNYPQDYGVRVTQKKDMPSRRNIVVKPMKADLNQTPNTDLKTISAKDKENRSKREVKIFKPQVGRGGFRRGGKGMNVKKEAKSPKALAHKRKYETEYESSPARKKYRRELERERRKRGVAGKGGGDMSHTKTGKIVVEDPHTNRARSHPSVGSTLKMVVVKAPRIPRKKGQPANSKKHSDLYTDENPKGTIHGLGFKNPAKAKQSVVKSKNSSRSHAHKTQAAIAMEQRAKEMGKKKEAGVYRNFIESQKKKTKQLKKAFPAKFAGNCRECGTYLPVGEMVNMGKYGGIVCRDAPRCGMKYVV